TGIYHPGDSFDVPTDAAVDTLFVPASGPWLKLAEAVEFVRAVAPRQAYALHDALWNEMGQSVWDRNMTALAQCPYERLTPGQSVCPGPDQRIRLANRSACSTASSRA